MKKSTLQWTLVISMVLNIGLCAMCFWQQNSQNRPLEMTLQIISQKKQAVRAIDMLIVTLDSSNQQNNIVVEQCVDLYNECSDDRRGVLEQRDLMYDKYIESVRDFNKLAQRLLESKAREDRAIKLIELTREDAAVWQQNFDDLETVCTKLADNLEVSDERAIAALELSGVAFTQRNEAVLLLPRRKQMKLVEKWGEVDFESYLSQE